MINLIEFMHEGNMGDISLNIYGSPLNYKDKLYEKYLNLLIEKSNLQNHIKIYEAVDHSLLNKYYEECNLYLNFSETALDKSVLEAMSTGIPILSCNACVEEIIDDATLKNLITFSKSDNLSLIAKKVFRLLNFSREEFDKYALKSNQFIKNNHSIENLQTLLFKILLILIVSF